MPPWSTDLLRSPTPGRITGEQGKRRCRRARLFQVQLNLEAPLQPHHPRCASDGGWGGGEMSLGPGGQRRWGTSTHSWRLGSSRPAGATEKRVQAH